MEKEQIIKSLKSCTTCDGCAEGECHFYDDPLCLYTIQRKALSLILEQEKRIEELEKEAAFWEREADNAVAIAEGNIRAEIASGGTSCHWCEDKIKDDTVRKMVERLKEKAMDVDMDDATLWMECVTVADIDRIAEEMLEGNA